MPHSDRAVLQVAIIKSQPRIDEYFFDAIASGKLDLFRKIILHHRDRVRAKIKIPDLAHIFPLHITNDHRRTVRRDHPEI